MRSDHETKRKRGKKTSAPRRPGHLVVLNTRARKVGQHLREELALGHGVVQVAAHHGSALRAFGILVVVVSGEKKKMSATAAGTQ